MSLPGDALGCNVDCDSIGKALPNSRIKPRMYVRHSNIYEKLHFVSRNWHKEN